jgi:hypothetical protein
MNYRPILPLICTLALICIPRTSFAGFTFQNFDSDPGWTIAGNGVNGNNFGYQSSAFANGSPGEAGGRFTRSTFVRSYADTTSVGLLNLNGPLAASGRFDFINDNGPDFGPGLLLGHFSTVGPAGIGILFNNNDTGTLHWSAVIIFNDGTELGTAPTLLGSNIDRTWSYNWDSTGGVYGGGVLTVSLSGANGGGTKVVDITAEARGRGMSSNAFGFNGQAAVSGQSDRLADIFIDDVTYSTQSVSVVAAVPAPPSLLIAGIGSLCVMAGQRARSRGQTRN